MPEHLYDARPSMFRMRPFATVVVLAIMIAALLVAGFTKDLVPPDLLAASLSVQLDDTGYRIVQIASGVIAALAALQVLAWWVPRFRDRVAITEDEILWTHGLLSKQYTEIGMDSVRTVRIRQSLLQRIVNAGDVSVFTSGDIPELVVKGLPQPDRIRELIKARSAHEV